MVGTITWRIWGQGKKLVVMRKKKRAISFLNQEEDWWSRRGRIWDVECLQVGIGKVGGVVAGGLHDEPELRVYILYTKNPHQAE